ETEHLHPPGVCPTVALAGLQRRRLAGAVGAEHGGDRVALDGEREVVDGGLVAVTHHQAVEQDGGSGRGHLLSLGRRSSAGSPRYADEPALPTTSTLWEAHVALHTVVKPQAPALRPLPPRFRPPSAGGRTPPAGRATARGPCRPAPAGSRSRS